MTKTSERARFVMEIVLDQDGRPQTTTRNQGMPYELIVGALSQQTHLYNNMWAKKASTTFEER